MARLVRAALEFNALRFRPRLIFAVFGRRLISPLHSFINLEVFEHNTTISGKNVAQGKVSFMLIFAGVLWSIWSNKSGVVENVDFCFFRSL